MGAGGEHRPVREEELIRKDREVAQKLTNAVARAQLWMRTHSDEQVAAAVAPYFPGISKETTVLVLRRYRETGAPIFSRSTVIDPEGLAKLEDVMVVGGVLSAEKKVACDAIVVREAAAEAQRLVQPK
jgi:NitT/TauT family transport system substrate-binding protein